MTTSHVEVLEELAKRWRIQGYQIGQGPAGNKARRKCADELDAAIALMRAPVRDAVPGRDRLWDSQWVNIVNHDECYLQYTKEEAVAKAVRLTEEAMRGNIAAMQAAGGGE